MARRTSIIVLPVACRHWRDIGDPRAGECGLGLWDGRPSRGLCRRCPSWDGPPRGAGDVVHAVAKRVAPRLAGRCGGCASRRAALNDALPMG